MDARTLREGPRRSAEERARAAARQTRRPAGPPARGEHRARRVRRRRRVSVQGGRERAGNLPPRLLRALPPELHDHRPPARGQHRATLQRHIRGQRPSANDRIRHFAHRGGG